MRAALVLAGTGRRGHDGAVPGVVIIVIVLVIALPVAVIMSGAVAAGLLGFFLKDDADARYAGTEYAALADEPAEVAAADTGR